MRRIICSIKLICFLIACAPLLVIPSAQSATISIQAEILNPFQFGYGAHWQNAIFGPSKLLRLDFHFSSFVPVSTTVHPNDITSLYDLQGVDLTTSNGRMFSFMSANPHGALQIGINGFNDTPPLLLHTLDANFEGRHEFQDSYLAPDDSIVFLSDFKFSFLADHLITNGGLPNTSLSAFNYLNNIPTPPEQKISLFALTKFRPDGVPLWESVSRDLYFGNYSVISNPAAIPIPASLPMFGMALAILGFAGRRRKRKNPPE